jgi:hypothetical protein
MKEIKLKETTRTAKWYALFYGIDGWRKEMPTDTCTYYRNVILSIPLLIITHIGVIWCLITNKCIELRDKIMATLTFWFIPMIFGMPYTEKGANNNFFKIWFYGLLTLIIVMIAFAIIICIVIVIQKIIKYYKSKRSENTTDTEPGIIKSWYKQLKDKTCSKIQWIK